MNYPRVDSVQELLLILSGTRHLVLTGQTELKSPDSVQLMCLPPPCCPAAYDDDDDDIAQQILHSKLNPTAFSMIHGITSIKNTNITSLNFDTGITSANDNGGTTT